MQLASTKKVGFRFLTFPVRAPTRALYFVVLMHLVAAKLAKTEIEDEQAAPDRHVVEESKTDAKAGAKIWYGHEESKEKAQELLEKFRLPVGLLPLQDVIECGYVESTGYLWLTQKNKIEHSFESISKQVRYAEEVKSYIEEGKIKKLEGVKAKELFMWVPVVDISVDGGKVHFKSFAGISKSFPPEAFAA
ncbi:hypothetical protein R1sor_002479 [Riccia sorocarpa]|uniref:DUF538 family protein n=1 Tax=Riccia sorocarpa TaxID=122646 RepID=A0ABD3H227_9MARC